MTSIKDIQLEIDGDVAIVRLNRPAKRNALSDALVMGVRDTFQKLPAGVRATCASGACPGRRRAP